MSKNIAFFTGIHQPLDGDGTRDILADERSGGAGGKGDVWVIFLDTDGTVKSPPYEITEPHFAFQATLIFRVKFRPSLVF